MARAPPQKIVYIGAKGALKNFLGWSAKNGFLIKYQKGDPLGWQVVESLREKASAPPPAPLLNLPLIRGKINIVSNWSTRKQCFANDNEKFSQKKLVKK